MQKDISDFIIHNTNFFDYSDLEKSLESSEIKIDQNPDNATNQSDQFQIPMTNSDYLVAFASSSVNYCVGIVDMVNSSKISATLGPAKTSRYYQIFLNSMAKILNRFGGFVIKNIGDCLLFYFPESKNSERKFGFLSSIECMLVMAESQKYISTKLVGEGLPAIDYRISADYGQVVIMKSNTSSSLDMIGPPVNMCTKINHIAPKNGIVIGGDMYQMVNKFSDYSFKSFGEFSLGFKQSYPVFTIARKNNL